MSILIHCTKNLEKKLAHPIHQAEEHSTPMLDIWHAALFTAEQKHIVLFTNQVTAFSLLVQAEEHMTFEKLESLFAHALMTQITSDKNLAQYHHVFERKLKHGTTLAHGEEETLHELVVEIQKLFTSNPAQMHDLTHVAHQINHTEFPELEFKSPSLTLLTTLGSLPHDEA